MQAVQCLNVSLGASVVDGTFPMPSSITQDWVPSRADIKKQVKFKCYQSRNDFIPTENASTLDPDAARLGMSLTGSYPVKVSAIKDLETFSRDTILKHFRNAPLYILLFLPHGLDEDISMVIFHVRVQ